MRRSGGSPGLGGMGGFPRPTARSYPTPAERMQAPKYEDPGGPPAPRPGATPGPAPASSGVSGEVDASIVQGFTLPLPAAGVLPYYSLTQNDKSNTANTSLLLTNVVVPNSLYLVVTRLVFRVFDPEAANPTFLGMTNPALLMGSVFFEVSPDGAVTSPGQFMLSSSAGSGGISTSGFPLINTDVAEALGWTGGMRYGLVIRPGGKLVTRLRQVAAFTAGQFVNPPEVYGCEVGGFYASPTYVETYLRSQGPVA